ncbi:MAG: pitrilysin family protein [Balneolaceae bacterium]
MSNWKSIDFVKKTTLDNGLKIITEKVESVKSVAVGVWVKTGSRNEPEEQAGITHFLEHMLFKGTEKRTAYDIALSMEAVGGYLNAFTSNEYTCYYSRCLDTQLPLALDVLTDMIQNPVFPLEEIEKEKKVVIEEMKMYRDSPEDFLFEEFNGHVFKNHPLGRPIIGYEDTVNSFTRDHLLDYINHRYQPWNILVSVAGNVEHEKVVKLVSDYFEESNSNPSVEYGQNMTSYQAEKKVITKPIEQTHMIIGRRGLYFDHDHKYLLLIANTVLGGGMSSRLHQNIREKFGYCYSIGTFNQSYTDAGLFGVYIGTDRNYVDHVRDLIFSEFQRLFTEPISGNEMEESKSQLKGKLLLSQESMNNRMTRLAKSELYFNRFVTLDELVENIDRVTDEDVKEFSEEFFNSEYYSETLLLPENGEQPEGG